MSFDDFLHIPRGVSQGAFAKSKPKLEDLRVVEFHRGNYKLHWKTEHEQHDFFWQNFYSGKLKKQ